MAMIETTAKFAFALTALCTLCGCGTMHSLNEGSGAIYGGVKTDLALGYICVAGAGQENQDAWARAYLSSLATLALAVDMPLSFAADTLTLPLTTLVTYTRLTSDAQKSGTPTQDANSKETSASAVKTRAADGASK
jgi:uncharacterized protein YceK